MQVSPHLPCVGAGLAACNCCQQLLLTGTAIIPSWLGTARAWGTKEGTATSSCGRAVWEHSPTAGIKEQSREGRRP